jgi:hypothetical protein
MTFGVMYMLIFLVKTWAVMPTESLVQLAAILAVVFLQMYVCRAQ